MIKFVPYVESRKERIATIYMMPSYHERHERWAMNNNEHQIGALKTSGHLVKIVLGVQLIC